MRESACLTLMHSFSDDAAIPNSQGNHVHALGESFSFGRFTSESFGCEKWSAFPHKRYVEEAKSYAQPGSVAQKKAFFEAHYKRVAAQKAVAAALLEQEKATAALNLNTQVSERVCDPIISTRDSETTNSSSHDSLKAVLNSHNLQIAILNSQTAVNEQQIMTQDASKVVDTDGHVSAVNPVDLAIDNITEAANTKKIESLNNLENLEDHVSVSVDSRTSQTERPLLKSKLNTDQEVTQPMIKRKPAISSLVSSIGRKPSRIPPSPAKYVVSVHPRKDKISTPRTKKTKDYIDNRRSTPRSLETLMNSSSVREPCKLTSPDVPKTQATKPPPSVRTTPKRGATPKKTPTKAFLNGVHKQPLATPSSVNRRMETPVHPTAAGSKSAGPKWHILSAVSKSMSAYRNKLQSPTISSPFVLRTEDRAAKRKQKLEEKFNEKEAQVQQETKFKGKAETELRRLRQSFCFKARPLPNFYKGRETPKNQIKKTPEANPKSLTPRRKPPSSTSSTKKKSSRRLWKNNDPTPTQHPLCLVAEVMSHENMSPNIQYRCINTHKQCQNCC